MRRDDFRIGDVISIDNADQPDWVGGKWRVRVVYADSVVVQPLNADLTVDEARDATHWYEIRDGGFIEHAKERT